MTISLGILTGISYVSGLDYYRGIHERVLAETPKRHLMPPNPPITMVSVDCDEYAHYLTTEAFDSVAAYLLKGVEKLVAAFGMAFGVTFESLEDAGLMDEKRA